MQMQALMHKVHRVLNLAVLSLCQLSRVVFSLMIKQLALVHQVACSVHGLMLCMVCLRMRVLLLRLLLLLRVCFLSQHSKRTLKNHC